LKETTSHCSESIDLSSVAAGTVVSSTAWLAPRIWGEVKVKVQCYAAFASDYPEQLGENGNTLLTANSKQP
jgi:hypothetical protein